MAHNNTDRNRSEAQWHQREAELLAEINALRAEIERLKDPGANGRALVARAVEPSIRRCAECGVEYVGRGRSRFHSDACRQRAHRRGRSRSTDSDSATAEPARHDRATGKIGPS